MCRWLTRGPSRSRRRPGHPPPAVWVALREQLHDLLVDRALDEDPAAGAAVLAGVVEHGIGGLAREALQVGVREHHVGALAAQLQADLLDGARGQPQDLLPGARLARERDLADTRMRREGRAGDRAGPGDDVHDTRREPGLQAQLTEPERRERRPRRRLEDRGIARRQRGCQLPGGHHQREVPGHDEADHADGLAQRQVQARLGDRDGLAVVLVRGPAVVLEHARCRADLPTGAADGLAHVARLELGQLLRVVADERREPQQGLAAPDRGPRPPLALECGLGRRDRPVHILRGARRDVRDDLAMSRLDDLERRAVGGLGRSAADGHVQGRHG